MSAYEEEDACHITCAASKRAASKRSATTALSVVFTCFGDHASSRCVCVCVYTAGVCVCVCTQQVCVCVWV
jgi:hypothetical protein